MHQVLSVSLQAWTGWPSLAPQLRVCRRDCSNRVPADHHSLPGRRQGLALLRYDTEVACDEGSYVLPDVENLEIVVPMRVGLERPPTSGLTSHERRPRKDARHEMRSVRTDGKG